MSDISLVIMFLAFCLTVIALTSQSTQIKELSIKTLSKLSQALLPSATIDDDDKPKTLNS